MGAGGIVTSFPLAGTIITMKRNSELRTGIIAFTFLLIGLVGFWFAMSHVWSHH